MTDRDNQPTVLESLFNNVLNYLDARWDLMLLNLTERSVGALSGIVAAVIAAVFGLLALLFLGIAGAVWLGQATGNSVWGYLIISGVFLVILAMVFTLAKNYIKRTVIAVVARQMNDDK